MFWTVMLTVSSIMFMLSVWVNFQDYRRKKK